jgi:hypothetical protein
MVSQRFGWLIVDGIATRRTTRGDVYWRCSCRCGRSIEVIGHNLKSGNTQSCGCLIRLIPEAKRLLEEYRRLGRLGPRSNSTSGLREQQAVEMENCILSLTFSTYYTVCHSRLRRFGAIH